MSLNNKKVNIKDIWFFYDDEQPDMQFTKPWTKEFWFKKEKNLTLRLQEKYKTELLSSYDWDELKNKIKKEGYKPLQYTYIKICKTNPEVYPKPYRALDGNHRLKVMKELYDEGFKIDGVGNDGTINVLEKESKLWNQLLNIPIRFALVFWVPVIFYLKSTLFAFLGIILLNLIIPDYKTKFKNTKHPIKRLGWLYNISTATYEWVISLITNLQFLSLVVILGFYCYYILTNHLIAFLSMVGGQIIVETLLRNTSNPEITYREVFNKIEKWLKR